MTNIYKKIIRIILIYFLFTVFLYFWGPLDFNYNNNLHMLSLVLLYFFVFFLGYILGVKNTKIYKRRFSIKFDESSLKIILFIFTISLFIFSCIQIGTFNPVLIFSKFLSSVTSIGEVYYENIASNLNSEGSIFTKMQTLFSPINYAVAPLGILMFSSIKSQTYKIFWIYTVSISIISNYITGTNIGLFRIIISIITSMLVLKYINNPQSIKRQKGIRNKIISIVIFSLLIIFVIIFTYNISSRMPTNEIRVSSAPIDWSHSLLQVLPDGLKSAFVFVTSYLTQGYLGMSYALNYPWRPTFLIGNSMFLASSFSFIGYEVQEILNRTYVYQAASEWSPTVNWHTAFTWWANDVSFIGVILLMFLLGMFFAITIKLSFSGDKIASLLLSLLVLLLIFIPMNNVVLSNPLTFVPFVSYFFFLIVNNQVVLVRYH